MSEIPAHLVANQPTSSAPGIIEQAKTLVAQTAEQVTALANQALNSQAAATATEQARSLGNSAAAAASSAATTASSLAGQAHAQAHAAAPSIVPAPSTGATGTAGIDTRGDLSPTNEADRAKLDKLFGERADAKELQDKGILHGQPNDALAGKRHELERSMKENKLEKEIAQRPSPEELVKKGILNPDEAPPAN